MKIPVWDSPENQSCVIDKNTWQISRLLELSRNLPVMDIPIDHLYVYCVYEKLSLREIVMHMKAVNDADLSKPIILDENGGIMDGRHRIMKTILLGLDTIKAVRFEENPTPCSVSD